MATTTKNGSSIHTSVVNTSTNNDTENDSLEGAFDVGDEFSLLAGNDGNPGLITFEFNAPDDSSVTGILAADEVSTLTDWAAHGRGALRLTGSSDLAAGSGRRSASARPE